MSATLERFQRSTLVLTALTFSVGYATVGLVFVLISVIWEGIATRKFPWRHSPLDIPLSLFLVVSLLSGLASAHKATALGGFAIAALSIFLGYGPLNRVLQRDRRFLEPFLLAWALGGLAAGVWAAVVGPLTGRPAVFPALPQNPLATTLLIAFFLTLRLALNARGASAGIFVIGMVAVTVGLLGTESRGAWPTLAVALAVFLLLVDTRHTQRILAVIAVVSVVSVGLTLPYLPKVMERTRNKANSTLYGDRVALAGIAIAIFTDHPWLGTGLGTFPYYQPLYRSSFDKLIPSSYAHNIFLNVAAEAGIFGLLSFAWLVLAAFIGGWRWYRRSDSGNEKLMSASTLSAFAAMMLFQQLDATILLMSVGIGFWSLIAILALPAPNSERNAAETLVRHAK
jgi:O-antigen ligase